MQFSRCAPGIPPVSFPSPSRELGHWWAQVDSNHPCPQFAMVALFRCRSHRFLAHWPSASLLPPPAALGSGPALIRRAVGIPPVSFPSSLSWVGSLVGSSGLEPPTSRLSGARSNQLSYEPTVFASQSVLVSPRSVLAVRNGRAASLTLASLPCSLGLRVASPATGGAPLRPRANLSRALTS